MTDNDKERPYKPSWIDNLNDWIESLPLPAWIFHVVLGIVLIMVQIPFLWFEGGLRGEELLPIIIFNGFAVPYLLALMQFLDNQAVADLNSMRPLLDTTEQEFVQYEYKLSNMPFLAPLVTGLAMLVLVFLLELSLTQPVRYAALEQLPVFTGVFQIIDKSSAFLFGVSIYHTIRQLRLVNSINSNHACIDLFRLRPLQAFSRLTALTAVALVIFVYLFMLINPDLFADPVILGIIVAMTILTVSIFVWPLWGVHRLMEIEKERMLHEIDLLFEEVFSEFNQHLQDRDYAATERLKGTITSLEIQHKRISAIPTWPWSSETARIALTAIALPLVLMIIQFFVLQALNQ